MVDMVVGRTGSRHICSETQSGDIDHQVIRGEIVENVSLLVSSGPLRAGKKAGLTSVLLVNTT